MEQAAPVGHNLTDRKLRELSARAASDGLKGWNRTRDGKLEPVQTVAGCIARGVLVTGRCTKHAGCDRRVQVDLAFWADHGFALMLWNDLVQQFSCGRLGGCGLDFRAYNPEGTPLVAMAEAPDTLVTFYCQAGRVPGYSAMASALLAGVRKRQHPLAETAGILTAARLLRLQCKVCKGHRRTIWYARGGSS